MQFKMTDFLNINVHFHLQKLTKQLKQSFLKIFSKLYLILLTLAMITSYRFTCVFLLRLIRILFLLGEIIYV